jgi:hypothetical protein
MEEENEWEYDYLGVGEATKVGLILTVADQMGVKVSVAGDQIVYDESADPDDVEVLVKLSKQLNK